MSGTKERNQEQDRPAGRDPAAPVEGGGTVPRTTEENKKAAEGERFEKAPNPGHPV
ncbi:hypothetical protein [Azospirillum sp. B2RO_4]|uniref:hypothetical protein n=1 Tax=Azospirillum sp. B2RO_4 TaxID=3027796 RepID=UPI003DA82F7D